MSDLQLSLLGIGGVLIVIVVLYNWIQERRYRKLAQQRFQSQSEDVLLRETTVSPPATERKEPVIADVPSTGEAVAAEPPARVEPQFSPTIAASEHAPDVDESIDYVVRLELGESVVAERARNALVSEEPFGKPTRWLGRTVAGDWLDVSEARDQVEFVAICGAMQLADRLGAASEEDLERMSQLAQQAASTLLAVAQIPERGVALQQAQALDEFCADVDVLVGINVIANGENLFPATKIRALAEAGGLRLGSDGTFQYRDDRGVTLYSLTNHESEPFNSDNIKELNTHGITLLFDVPRVLNGLRVFDQMMLFAHQLRDSLKGQLVDDNLRPLTDDGVSKIRGQLATIYQKMDTHGLAAGGTKALRLFS